MSYSLTPGGRRIASTLAKLTTQVTRAYTALLLNSYMLPKITWNCRANVYCIAASSRRQLQNYQKQLDTLHRIALRAHETAARKLGAPAKKRASAAMRTIGKLRSQAARSAKRLPGQTAICRG